MDPYLKSERQHRAVMRDVLQQIDNFVSTLEPFWTAVIALTERMGSSLQ